jgi:hypothetical protein
LVLFQLPISNTGLNKLCSEKPVQIKSSGKRTVRQPVLLRQFAEANSNRNSLLMFILRIVAKNDKRTLVFLNLLPKKEKSTFLAAVE